MKAICAEVQLGDTGNPFRKFCKHMSDCKRNTGS